MRRHTVGVACYLVDKRIYTLGTYWLRQQNEQQDTNLQFWQRGSSFVWFFAGVCSRGEQGGLFVGHGVEWRGTSGLGTTIRLASNHSLRRDGIEWEFGDGPWTVYHPRARPIGIGASPPRLIAHLVGPMANTSAPLPPVRIGWSYSIYLLRS